MSKWNKTRACSFCGYPASKKKRLRVFEQPIHINCLRYCILISKDTPQRKVMVNALTASGKTIEKSGRHISPSFVFYKLEDAPFDLHLDKDTIRFGKFEEI